MKNYFFLILLFASLFFSKFSFSQDYSFSFTAGYGVNKLMSEIKSNPSGSGGMGFYFNPINALDVGFNFDMGSFNGKDKTYIYKTTTGVQFSTPFYDYGFKAKYNLYSLINHDIYSKYAFYVTTGIGFIEFRDRLEDLNGNFLEGFGYDNAGGAKPKTTTELYIPFGLGFKYKFEKYYSLSFEPTFTWCNTGKLDYIKDNNKKDYYFYFPLIFEYKLYTKK